jgi:hypothetical protein
MSALTGSGHDELMEILIVLDVTDPPAGLLRVPGQEGHEEIRFAGWLGLLRVLGEALGSPAPAGGEL